MSYIVQKGDTIAEVTEKLGISWDTLRRLNPEAIGKSSRTGHWFVKEGAVLKGRECFETILEERKADLEKSVERNKASTRWMEYTVKRGDTLWDLAVRRFHVHLKDLIKDNNIKDPRKIMPGQKIRIRIPSYPEEQEVTASWYGKAYHGRTMANGEPFNMFGKTIAHKNLPLGTKVELENPLTGKKIRAVVADRGPYIPGRSVDLSYSLAKTLSLNKEGVGRLVMRVLG